MNTLWEQWDKQVNIPQASYIELNNLYLAIQKGEKRVTITTSNRLRTLVGQAYKQTDTIMRDYWQREFEKLPRWNEV